MTTINGLQVPSSLNPIIDYSTPSSGGSTYTLPTGANILAGQRVKIVNGGTGSILVNGSDATLVRTVYPGTSGEVMALQNNPTNQAHWAGLDNIVSVEAFYTPVCTLTVNVTAGYPKGSWWRQGGNLIGRVHMLFTGVSNSALTTFSIPSGLTIDTARQVQTNAYYGVIGTGFERNGTNGNVTMAVPDGLGGSPTVVTFNRNGDNNLYNGGNTVSGTELHLNFSVPIVGWTATRG